MSPHGKNNKDIFSDDDLPSMLLEQFETAAGNTKIQNPDLIGAARLVLVSSPGGSPGQRVSVADAAAAYGVQEHYLYRAIKSIEKAWTKICKARGWEIKSAALTPEMWQVLEAIQLQALDGGADKAVAKRESRRNKV